MVLVFFVALIGLEPIQTEPESAVLPLHHKAMRRQKYIFFYNFRTPNKTIEEKMIKISFF